MNIGFDLDRIFINTPPFVPYKIIEMFYRQKTTKDIPLYRIPSTFEQKIRLLAHHKLLRPPMRENIRYIQKNLPKKGNKYYLISSRFSFLKEKTEELVRQYRFDKIFDGIFMNIENKQPHHFKHEVIEKLSIDSFVDDDLPLLLFLAKKNLKTTFYWFNRKRAEKLSNNLFAITHISEILR